MHVLGRLSIVGPDGAADEADLPGALGRVAIVALVLAHGPTSREAIGERLWGESLPAEWGSGLSAMLSKIRAILGQVGIERSRLSTTSGAIELRLPADTWVDIEDGIRRLDRAEGALRHGEVVPALLDATVASSILGRDFLPGIDNTWADQIRRDLVSRRSKCHVVLSEGWRQKGDLPLAYDSAMKVVKMDPISERGYRLAMMAALAMGETGRVQMLYDECSATLDRELGVAPSKETAELHENSLAS